MMKRSKYVTYLINLHINLLARSGKDPFFVPTASESRQVRYSPGTVVRTWSCIVCNTVGPDRAAAADPAPALEVGRHSVAPGRWQTFQSVTVADRLGSAATVAIRSPLRWPVWMRLGRAKLAGNGRIRPISVDVRVGSPNKMSAYGAVPSGILSAASDVSRWCRQMSSTPAVLLERDRGAQQRWQCQIRLCCSTEGVYFSAAVLPAIAVRVSYWLDDALCCGELSYYLIVSNQGCYSWNLPSDGI